MRIAGVYLLTDVASAEYDVNTGLDRMLKSVSNTLTVR